MMLNTEKKQRTIKTLVAKSFGYKADVTTIGDHEVWIELNDEDERWFSISNYDGGKGRFGIDFEDNEFSPADIDGIASIVKALSRED